MKTKFAKPEDIPALRVLWKEAFCDTDAFLDAFYLSGFRADHCRCIIESGKALCALYWFDCKLNGKDYAYLYAVATAQSHRGMGLCRTLMDDTHALLARQSYAGAILVPGEESLFRFYEAMGYRTCSTVEELTVTADCTSSKPIAALISMSAHQYAAARRELLPPGGVIQEGESLAFLQSYVRFYRGDSWVLAADSEGGILNGMEYLGDPNLLPAITAALGCRKGQFRTMGSSRDFAMFLPLAADAPTPEYFGLAFD